MFSLPVPIPGDQASQKMVTAPYTYYFAHFITQFQNRFCPKTQLFRGFRLGWKLPDIFSPTNSKGPPTPLLFTHRAVGTHHRKTPRQWYLVFCCGWGSIFLLDSRANRSNLGALGVATGVPFCFGLAACGSVPLFPLYFPLRWHV